VEPPELELAGGVPPLAGPDEGVLAIDELFEGSPHAMIATTNSAAQMARRIRTFMVSL
jgi:hypothetical protein